MGTMTRVFWRRTAAVVATLAGLSSAGVLTRAHPLSPTVVSVIVDPKGRVDVDVTMDADAMITRLDSGSFETPGDEVMPPDRKVERLRILAAVLERSLVLTVDGRPLRLSFDRVTVDALNDATVRLDAEGPAGAEVIEFKMSLAGAPYALTVRTPGGDHTTWVSGPAASGPIVLDRPDTSRAVREGVALGFLHVVPRGLDHILFVVGLGLVLVRRQVLLVVTAFTLAHSITLGLGLYGVVSLPSYVVEPLIALSVAYIGVENLLRPGPGSWRIVVVFLFGLLHGLGFASVLGELVTAPAARFVTLVSFNIGVEIGQLAVVAVTLACLAAISAANVRAVLPAARAASAGVAFVGAIWTIERLMGAGV
jgi:hypothetical protein